MKNTFRSSLFLFVCVSLLCLAIGLLSGCGYKAGQTIKLNDPSELYSTYKLADHKRQKKRVLKQIDKDSTRLDKIIAQANENNWPVGIRTLEKRKDNRKKMFRYKGEVVAKFRKRYVIMLPKEHNAGVTEEMKPARDIYMIIGRNGVEKINKY